MESLSDRESIETEESMADNFNTKKTICDAKDAEPSRVPSRQGNDDGYACELYALRDEQLAQEKRQCSVPGPSQDAVQVEK